MFNHLHQIEAELTPFNLAYLDLFLLMLKVSFGRGTRDTISKNKSSKSQKVAIIGPKPRLLSNANL